MHLGAREQSICRVSSLNHKPQNYGSAIDIALKINKQANKNCIQYTRQTHGIHSIIWRMD